jgi:hypothetical protein
MKILLLVLAVLAAAIVGGLAWLGAFTGIAVEERDMGPYGFVYVQEASDDFGRIGQLTEALGARLEQAGLRERKPAQVYFPAGRGIQNQIGFIVEQKPVNEVLGAETFFRPIPVQRYMVARFPFRNPMSFMIGGARVSGAFERHRAARKYGETQALVILDGGTILYLQPIEPG